LQKARHLYVLTPQQKEDHWSYTVDIPESPKKWEKDLNLRFTPEYQVLHLFDDELLIKINQRSAFVNIKTQNARWANLDDLLLGGDLRQDLWGTTDSVIQTLFTPYEYRGHLLNGVNLRSTQKNKRDPFIEVLATQKLNNGYRSYLRSFLHMWIYDYDLNGKLIKENKLPLNRFDFLALHEQLASTVKNYWKGQMSFVVDGTRIVTSSIDVIKNGHLTSWHIPTGCSIQSPVKKDDRLLLPLYCFKDMERFELRYVEL